MKWKHTWNTNSHSTLTSWWQEAKFIYSFTFHSLFKDDFKHAFICKMVNLFVRKSYRDQVVEILVQLILTVVESYCLNRSDTIQLRHCFFLLISQPAQLYIKKYGLHIIYWSILYPWISCPVKIIWKKFIHNVRYFIKY